MRSYQICGVEATPVDVSVTFDTFGPPGFDIVGLPELATREARVRVRSAIKQSGRGDIFAGRRIVVTVHPPVTGPCTHLDLPIALAVLGLDHERLVAGELSLAGAVRPVVGIIAAAKLCHEVVVPWANVAEARAVCPSVLVADALDQVVENWTNRYWPAAESPVDLAPAQHKLCWSDVRGHDQAKRALEVAAAGGHNILLVGAPGTGKVMLARRLPTILPDMTHAEAVEATTVHSVAGLLPGHSDLLTRRPFRAPHHTASAAALVGGGSTPRPGEVSLAHRGVLFLDELAEFPRANIEALREPLETGKVTVTRARQTVQFPADCLVVGAANPCACSHYGTGDGRCVCSGDAIERYRDRLRYMSHGFAMQLNTTPIGTELLRHGPSGETSEQVKARVTVARQRQMTRQSCLNSKLQSQALPNLGEDVEDLLRRAITEYNLNGTQYREVRRIARTIADLGGAEKITLAHLAEALQHVRK